MNLLGQHLSQKTRANFLWTGHPEAWTSTAEYKSLEEAETWHPSTGDGKPMMSLEWAPPLLGVDSGCQAGLSQAEANQ